MSVKFVQGVLWKKNGVPLWGSPRTESIPCENAIIEGVEWWIPTTCGGRLTGYTRYLGASAGGSTPPQADAVKTLRVHNTATTDTIWILITAADDESEFTNNCNGCCGSTPVMPAVTIPAPIVEDCICKDDSGNYVFDFPIPSNPNTLKYLLNNPTFNGVAGASLSGSGYASPAALLSAAATAYAAQGTWSLQASNTILRLISTTVSCANVQVTLLTATYCLTLPVSASNVNGIKIGTTVCPFGTFQVSQTLNQAALISAISAYLIGTVALASGDTKVQYTGLQVPASITMDGVNVATFTVGACV